MEAQGGGAAPSTGRGRRRGKRGDGAHRHDVPMMPTTDEESLAIVAAYGGGDPRGGSSSGKGSFTKNMGVVHHHPPKEMAADVGYPVRGGQTLLIAYFPWEAAEEDIEREFSKFCNVKRVHLVIDKSSRKPRCFGFVKFHSKGDAEEALRVTMLGLVQLPDTRGHVWHVKAEWTKSGDMVVDDSETEQEVAKRKEDRRSRVENGMDGELPDEVLQAPQSPPAKGRGQANGRDGRSRNSKWPPGGAKGSSMFPAPLPPLAHHRYPQGHAPLGYPNQPPMMQQHQGPLPLPQHAPGHMAATVPPHQHIYGNIPGGVQQSLPMYSGYGGQPPPGPLYPGLPGGVIARGPPPSQALLEAPSAGGGLPQPPLRDLLGGAQGYGAPHHAYVTPHNGYPPQPGGYGPLPPAQNGYVGQPGAYPGQPPYANQQLAAASFAGHQAAYAAAASQQGAYAASQQAYAAAQHPAYPPAYPPQPTAYAPQQPGIPSQPGYASPPPNYASASQPSGVYAASAYGAQQPPPNYGGSPYGSPLQPGHGIQPPVPYSYQMGPPPPMVADGSYPGQMPPSTGLLSHPGQGLLPEAHHIAHQQGSVGSGVYASPEMSAQLQDPSIMAAHQNGHMVMVPNVQMHQLGSPSSPAPAQLAQVDRGEAQEASCAVAQAAAAATAVNAGGTAPAPSSPPDQEYLDHVFMHFPEMSLHDKNAGNNTGQQQQQQQAMPAPPAQEPPAPPPAAGAQWQTETFSEASTSPGQAPAQPQPPVQGTGAAPRPGGPGGSASPWNSFDDAYAQGMVDGLVGEDGIPAPNWTAQNAAS